VLHITGIDFLTIRGAGHFVPAEKPLEALQMISNFISNLDYSMPSVADTQPSCCKFQTLSTVCAQNVNCVLKFQPQTGVINQ
jgi:hypothetical protein